jgi:hypothetical protein
MQSKAGVEFYPLEISSTKRELDLHSLKNKAARERVFSGCFGLFFLGLPSPALS